MATTALTTTGATTPTRTDPPRVGLALGGGGFKGLSHLGVLEVFEQNDIPIDLIAGTSIGALVAALYACGTDLALTIRYAEKFNYKGHLDFCLHQAGFIKGESIQQLIATLTKNWTFDRTRLPLCVVATDIVTGEKVVLSSGRIHEAVRASISLPGIFLPYELDGRTLVDGGLLDNVPAGVVREMGADVVIAVDIGVQVTPERKLTRPWDVLLQAQDIISMDRSRHSPIPADIILYPDMTGHSTLTNKDAAACIQRGRDEAQAKLPEIRELLGL